MPVWALFHAEKSFENRFNFTFYELFTLTSFITKQNASLEKKSGSCVKHI